MDLLKPTFLGLDVIREESSAHQVSIGVCIGAFLAVTPVQTPQFILGIFLLSIFRISLLAALMSWTLFSTLFLGISFDSLGRYVLVGIPALRRLWAGLYHWPIFPFTQFNNTVVMGGMVFYTVICVPLYVLVFWTYKKFSLKIFDRIQDSLFGTTLKASQFFRYYGYHISSKKRQKQ